MKDDKYILQFGSLAGWPFTIAKELRNRNINSQNVVYEGHKDVEDLNRQLQFDKALFKKTDSFFTKIKNLLIYLHQVPKEVNLIHYHSSNVFFRELHGLYEGPLYARKKIPMLITFGGGDIRNIRKSNKINQYFWLKNSFSTRYRDIRTWIRFKSWGRKLNYAMVDPEFYEELKPYFKKIFIFRQPVEVNKIDCVIPEINNSLPIILHIPTEPKVKGTDVIVKVCERLKKEGYKFEFVLKRQLTQEEMYKEISKCDIYVDELRCGAHGVTAVETMCAGKPTLTYIRDDLVKVYPEDLPLVNSNPDTIYDNLKQLIVDSKLRNQIGLNSRAYVDKYHDSKVVVDNIIEVYQEISDEKLVIK